jgi:Rrf2 family protein
MMQFSRRADYAIRATAVLTDAATPMKRRELADRTGAPSSVLAQALADLARAGVVVARAGPSGGYELARPASEISLLDVVRAAGDLASDRRCVLEDRACADRPCAVHGGVAGADQAYLDALGRATLAGARAAEAEAPEPTISSMTFLD